MKKSVLSVFGYILFSQCFSQSWYSMGNLDTLGSPNGSKAIGEICYFNNELTIGGFFKFDGTTTLNSVGWWDGIEWQPLGIGIWIGNGWVEDSIGGGQCAAVFKNRLITAGGMLGAGGAYINDSAHLANGIAKWDGTDWYPLSNPGSGVNNGVAGLGVYNNNLYLGGAFGGSFDSTGVHSTHGIARWNDSVFSACGYLSGDFTPLYNYFARCFQNYQNKMIVGGDFTAIDGSPYGTYSGIAAYNDTIWSALGNGFNNAVYSLTVFNGELYAGGIFTASRDNLTPFNHIAKWNGASWQAVGEGLNDTIYTLTVDSVNNTLYAGGGFKQTGLGASAKHLAKWNGTNWQEVGGGTNRSVRALFSKDGNLYVGGFFTYVQDTIEAHLIAMWGDITNGVSSELGIRNYELGIYPNPNNGEFSISTKNSVQNMQIEITNVLGQQVYKAELQNTNQTTIKLNQPSGIYFLSIIADEKCFNNKIVISH